MSDFEQFEERVSGILRRDPDHLDVSEKSLFAYLNYLKGNIAFPCGLTGIEDFEWEEYYVWGQGDKDEYNVLKKTRPSYTDTFKLLSFHEEFDPFYGLFANVKRISDNKKFTLPLSELKATDKKSKNYLLLDDYSTWFVNYR